MAPWGLVPIGRSVIAHYGDHMSTELVDPTMRTSAQLLRMGLLALFASLVLAACGSSAETTETDSSASESDVTDPEETDPVEDADSGADAPADEVDEAVSPDVTEPDIVVEATTTTVAVVETTTTEEEAMAVPAAGPGLGAFAVRVFETGELGLSPAEQGCVDGRLQSELRIDRTTEFDTLTVEQQAISIEILLDCAGGRLEPEFLSSFDSDAFDEFGIDDGEQVGSCIYRELSRDDEDQPKALLAVASITADQPAPEETIDAGSRLFARCFDLTQVLISSFAETPEMASLVDTDCLRAAVTEDLTADLFASVFRDPESGVVPDSFSAIVNCMQFGQLMAEQFADVVTFSEAEISCIDEVFRTDAIFQAMVNDEDLPDEAVNGMLGCLEPATLAALNG